MIKSEITPYPQFISQTESWETVYNISNSNLTNINIKIPEIDDYFCKLRPHEIQGEKIKNKHSTQESMLIEQIQELNKANEELQRKVDSCKNKIEQYDDKVGLDYALKFKIRILIRNNADNLITKFNKQNEERKNALGPIEKRLNSKSINNLMRNQANISQQVINSNYDSVKDRIEAIAKAVNLPSVYDQSIE